MHRLMHADGVATRADDVPVDDGRLHHPLISPPAYLLPRLTRRNELARLRALGHPKGEWDYFGARRNTRHGSSCRTSSRRKMGEARAIPSPYVTQAPWGCLWRRARLSFSRVAALQDAANTTCALLRVLWLVRNQTCAQADSLRP